MSTEPIATTTTDPAGWFTLSLTAHLPAGRRLGQPSHDDIARLGMLLSDLFGFEAIDTLQVEQSADTAPWLMLGPPGDQAVERFTRWATDTEVAELATALGVDPEVLAGFEVRLPDRSLPADKVSHLAGDGGPTRCCHRPILGLSLELDRLTADPADVSCPGARPTLHSIPMPK